MTKDTIYSGTREVRTFADLSHGADVLIQKTEEVEKGSYYTAMSALLLTAFTFEAYLNHLGDMHIKFWEEIEPIKVMNKYTVLCKDLELVPDFSSRPYQTLTALFKFRNAIAHGKSKVLNETKEANSKKDLHEYTPKAHWEEYSTLDNTKRAKEDVSQVITELHKKVVLGDYPFINGCGMGSLSLKPSK